VQPPIFDLRCGDINAHTHNTQHTQIIRTHITHTRTLTASTGHLLHFPSSHAGKLALLEKVIMGRDCEKLLVLGPRWRNPLMPKANTLNVLHYLMYRDAEGMSSRL